MFTIRIGKKRIKLLNWLIFISCCLLIIYVLGSLFFLLPIFKKTYNYEIKKENYEIKKEIIFKNFLYKCSVKEIYGVKVDEEISEYFEKDLIKDGFVKEKNKYVKTSESLGFCKKIKNEYKKEFDKDYIIFDLKGDKNISIDYDQGFIDPYVDFRINKKYSNEILVNTNLNNKKIGRYIISYETGNLKYNKQRLYRIIDVVDREKPVITLNGNEEQVLEYNSNYVEEGFVAIDNYDGDITKNVTVNNQINSNKPGIYYITYKVKDSSSNTTTIKRKVIIKEKSSKVTKEEPIIEQKDGLTYVNGILLVNKKYGLPKDYDPNVNKEALSALKQMQADASAIGLDLSLISGYRSYSRQEQIYNNYVKEDGKEKANTYSAKPGYSEHQTGLAFDVGQLKNSFKNTPSGKWLAQNAHLYGFIIRYPEGKSSITGYIYEPWHIRYLGIEIATKVKESNLSLEEYLGIN